jgi:hypothetical protein
VFVVRTVVDGEAAFWMIAGPPFSNTLVLRKDGVVVNHVISKFPGHCERAGT